jgi:hypothetical protein
MVRRGNLLINANWLSVLEAAGLTDFDAVMNHSTGQSLAKAGLAKHRTRDRITLGSTGSTGSGGGGNGSRAIYLKRYRPGLMVRLKRRFSFRAGPSEAADEWSAVLGLAAAGIGVPEPVLVGPGIQASGSRASCIAIAELADAQSLEAWLPANAATLSPEQRAELFGELAKFVGRFHATGLVHRDLYLGHIFIRWNPSSPPMFWLIDLARVFRPVRWRQVRWLVKDLAQLRYSLGAAIRPDEWAAMLKRYAVQAGRPEREMIPLAGRLARKSAAIARHDARRRRRLGSPP